MHGVLRRSTLVAGVLALALVAALQAAAGPPGGDYKVTPLVSDIPGAAPVTDPDLVNGWGLARSATSPWWVADNGPDPSTASRRSTTEQARSSRAHRQRPRRPDRRRLRRRRGQLPDRDGHEPDARGRELHLRDRGRMTSGRGVAATTALVAPTTGIAAGAVFKGLAIAQPTPGNPLLYATDFHNAQVDIFDGAWQNVTPPARSSIRTLPDGYAPFGIQTIGSRHLRHVREAGRRRRGRRRRPEPRLRRRVRPAGEPGRAGGTARPAERAVGPGDGAGVVRPLRGRPARRQLRRRPDQRLRERQRRLAPRRHAALARAAASS